MVSSWLMRHHGYGLNKVGIATEDQPAGAHSQQATRTLDSDTADSGGAELRQRHAKTAGAILKAPMMLCFVASTLGKAKCNQGKHRTCILLQCISNVLCNQDKAGVDINGVDRLAADLVSSFWGQARAKPVQVKTAVFREGKLRNFWRLRRAWQSVHWVQSILLAGALSIGVKE